MKFNRGFHKAFCLVAFGGACLTGWAAQRTKVIAHGWDLLTVSPRQLLENAEALDELPIDGVIVNMLAKKFNGQSILRDDPWEFEAFEKLIPVYRELGKHRSLRHSFAGAWFCFWQWKRQHRIDWQDDAAWAKFAHNFGVLAKIVREGNLEGIAIDNEDYGGVRQFHRVKEDSLDYDALLKLARQRGREVFGAAFKEKPDLKVLAFFLTGMDTGDYIRSGFPREKAREAGDLWQAFFDGILDVIPKEAQLVEGNEASYYYRHDSNKWVQFVNETRNGYLPFVSPENRVAYRGQLQIGTAQYLDAYVHDDKSIHWYRGPLPGGTRFDHFARNLKQGVDTSEGYTWVYGERHPWIHWLNIADEKGCKGQTWDEMMPGLYDMIGYVRSAGYQGAKRYADWQKSGKVPQNLLASGNCAPANVDAGSGLHTNVVAKGWQTWNFNEKKGAFGTDASVGRGDSFSLFADHVKRGCAWVTVKNVKEGDRYVVRVAAKGERANFEIGYHGGDVECVDSFRPRGEFRRPGADGWREGYAYVIVPKGADNFCIYLGVDSNETIRYDDVAVYADDLRERK